MDIEKLQGFFDKASYQHLLWAMGHKGEFLKPNNFSTVQYANPRVHKDAVKFNTVVANQIKKIYPNKSFLNMGTAAGHLPFAIKQNEIDINIKNVEWDHQLVCCEKIRDIFDINISYVCNDVYADDFCIEGCDEVFDYVIMQRFFPIYWNNEPEGIDRVLKKFIPYAKNALIIESDTNWSRGIMDYVRSISRRRVLVGNQWNMWEINLDQFV